MTAPLQGKTFFHSKEKLFILPNSRAKQGEFSQMVTLGGRVSGPGDQGQGGEENPADEEHAPSPLTSNRTGSSLAPSSPPPPPPFTKPLGPTVHLLHTPPSPPL